MTAKFEEELEKAHLVWATNMAISTFGENHGKSEQELRCLGRVPFFDAAEWAQSFYLPLLREAMAALEFYKSWPTKEIHGLQYDVISSNDKGLKAIKTLASIRTQLGEEK